MVDLIYMDPPFFTQRDWGAYADTWAGMVAYIGFMRERCKEAHRLLKDTGSLFLHCDWRASHRLRVMLDGVLGMGNFVNEIIWSYKPMTNPIKKQFPRKHDSIFWYCKNKSNQEKTKNYKEIYYKEFKHGWIFKRWKDFASIEDGKYVLKYGTHPEKDSRFIKCQLHNFIKKHKREPRNGEVIFEFKGEAITDVWLDINSRQGFHKEKIRYPTEKPIALLKRIIECSTDKGDLVVDPFCGSGTTLAAAKELDRMWVGIDTSDEAVGIARGRLE